MTICDGSCAWVDGIMLHPEVKDPAETKFVCAIPIYEPSSLVGVTGDGNTYLVVEQLPKAS